MDFGKLPSLENVNFKLATDPPENRALSAHWNKPEAPQLFVGPTGYNMKAWVGKWYPHGAKEKDYLRHYGAQFNTIEHNTTHYRIPDYATVTRWRNETPADFKFCPKIPQSISHSRDLGLTGREISVFCTAIAELGEKLGPCFIQLPPGFSSRNLLLLQLFLEQFPVEIPLAVEVRHPSFFVAGTDSARYFELLEKHGRSAVITDVAGRRDVCHLRLTARQVLVRFVGNGLHPSDYSRVEDWALRLKHWFDLGLEQAYFFSHEPDNLFAPELALFCAEQFAAAIPNVQLRGPKIVPGQQGALF